MSRAFTKERDDDPGPVFSAGPRGTYFISAADLARLPAEDERRARAEIITVESSVVGFGATVRVRDGRGKTLSYAIVNDEDAIPRKGSIGISSPLAQALLGKRVGDIATWHRPVGDATITIEAIAYAG